MVEDCSSCLEGILGEVPIDVRGGCHFCLIKSDIETYSDILNSQNSDLNLNSRFEIIGRYISNKHSIHEDTFSKIYAHLGYKFN